MNMRSFVVLLYFGLVAVTAFGQDKPAPMEVSGGIDWVFDIKEGQELSRANGKPIFIVFRCER